MHHATLKAAVAAYLSFHTAGASAEEVKKEIAKDPKEFDEAGIDEIYAAILKEAGGTGDTSKTGGDESSAAAGSGAENKGKKKKHLVVSPFIDINNFEKQWKSGDDVSHFDAARLEGLVDKKLVEVK